MTAQLPKLAHVEKLSPNIIRVLGGNPSKFTLQGSNTYLLGSGPSRLLLDTGQGFPEWKTNLQEALRMEGNPRVEKCLLSHWHRDHIGGVQDLREVCPGARFYKHTPSLDPDGVLGGMGAVVEEVWDRQVFNCGGEEGEERAGERGMEFEIKALHCPGHTRDHMAFVVTKGYGEEEEGAIFTGDNVLGHGTAVFEDLATYLSSLERMGESARAGVRAYPAHGAVIEDAKGKIEEYIAHRQQREQEAVAVLGGHHANSAPEQEGQSEYGSMEMVKVIYKAYPESLHAPAEGGLLQVLKKLEGEGKVQKVEGGKWKLGPKSAL